MGIFKYHTRWPPLLVSCFTTPMNYWYYLPYFIDFTQLFASSWQGGRPTLIYVSTPNLGFESLFVYSFQVVQHQRYSRHSRFYGSRTRVNKQPHNYCIPVSTIQPWFNKHEQTTKTNWVCIVKLGFSNTDVFPEVWKMLIQRSKFSNKTGALKHLPRWKSWWSFWVRQLGWLFHSQKINKMFQSTNQKIEYPIYRWFSQRTKPPFMVGVFYGYVSLISRWSGVSIHRVHPLTLGFGLPVAFRRLIPPFLEPG